MLVDALVYLLIAKGCHDLRTRTNSRGVSADKLRAEQERRRRELDKRSAETWARLEKLREDNERWARMMRAKERPATCPGCGAPVSGDRCEYCGTEF